MSAAMQNVNDISWFFCSLIIALVVFQAILFLRNALQFNKLHHVLSEPEVKSVMQIGVISAIGPACSIIIVALGLMRMVGPAITFMRVGVIGSASWETQMAGIAAQTLGVEFGTPQITESVMTLCIFAMTMGSAPYILNTIFTVKTMDKAMIKASGNKHSFMPTFSLAAAIALMTYMTANSSVRALKPHETIESLGAIINKPAFVAVLTSAAATVLLTLFINKTGKKALGSYNLTFTV